MATVCKIQTLKGETLRTLLWKYTAEVNHRLMASHYTIALLEVMLSKKTMKQEDFENKIKLAVEPYEVSIFDIKPKIRKPTRIKTDDSEGIG